VVLLSLLAIHNSSTDFWSEMVENFIETASSFSIRFILDDPDGLQVIQQVCSKRVAEYDEI